MIGTVIVGGAIEEEPKRAGGAIEEMLKLAFAGRRKTEISIAELSNELQDFFNLTRKTALIVVSATCPALVWARKNIAPKLLKPGRLRGYTKW